MQGGKTEVLPVVVLYDKIHGTVAQLAHAIKENDSFGILVHAIKALHQTDGGPILFIIDILLNQDYPGKFTVIIS